MESKSGASYLALAPLVGAIITIMNLVNSAFSKEVGSFVASVVIHLAGLAVVSVVLLAKRGARDPGRLPIYYYLGGVLGVGTVYSGLYAYSHLPASLAVALALLGQTLVSLAIDATGFLGRPRHPLSARRPPGILSALAGVAIMAGPWRSSFAALAAALVAGMIPGFSFVLNAELGRRRGVMRSVRMNYITGLATVIALSPILAPRPPQLLGEIAQALAAAGPLLALGGGTLGVVMVGCMNLVVARSAAFTATILVFSGQTATGLIVDAIAEGRLDLGRLLGALVLLGGLAVDSALTARAGAGTAAQDESKPSM